MLLSNVCLSRTSGLTQRPGKTKIGTERCTRLAEQTQRSSSHTWLKTPTFKVKVTRPLYSARPYRVRQVQRWPWERIGRGKVLLRCVGEALGRPQGGEPGHIVSPRAQLVQFVITPRLCLWLSFKSFACLSQATDRCIASRRDENNWMDVSRVVWNWGINYLVLN